MAFLFVCFAFFFFCTIVGEQSLLPNISSQWTMEHVLGKGRERRGAGRKASRISKLHQRHPIAQGKGTSSILHSHSPVNSQSRLESCFFLYIYHGNEKRKKKVAKQQRKAQDETALAVWQKLRSKQGAEEMRRIPVNCEIKAIC